MPLDFGPPARQAEARLAALSPEGLFAGRKVADKDMARCCLAGLWLYLDFFDESHAVSQDVATAEGSYWHGLLHRREPDFFNAKYWFRRVGDHPIFAPLRDEAARLAADGPAAGRGLAARAGWDPFAFVDLCEAARSGKPDLARLCQQVQQREWELLFDHCYRAAAGHE
jgi:hypothetical protein